MMFEDLSPPYGAIYADPPWHFQVWSEVNKNTRLASDKYPVMGTDDICAMPVRLLSADDAVLFMWVTWPQLLDGIKVISEWGFTYKTCAFAWIKADNTQPDFFKDEVDPFVGMGYWTRANSEVCLLGTKGSPKRLNADVRQAVIEPRREHSRKPDGIPSRIERLVPGPYLELFARTTRQGWDCWGNQTGKFRQYDAATDLHDSYYAAVDELRGQHLINT